LRGGKPRRIKALRADRKPTESRPFANDSPRAGAYAGLHFIKPFAGRTVMILSLEPNYPSARQYVLKLHRDARPGANQFFGRVESIVSGHSFEFRSTEELVAGLVGLALDGL
jgi:hypothetical protein